MLNWSFVFALCFTATRLRCAVCLITRPDQQVDDDDFESDSNTELIPGRQRREPAIWGEPAPDYSGVVLDGMTRYLHTLLFVDSKITRHYNFNMPLVKEEVLKMVKEANDYLYQINMRIIVVDVLQTQRSDLSLYSFEQFRNTRMDKLPRHDFAALISYRYAGGLAFVSGMCTSKAVMLCGFYPHDPAAMGSIFFHEVAHLVGVPHRNATESLEVPNCVCDEMSEDEKPSGPVGCLKIPGYDHDCTLQQMANLLYKNRCLRSTRSTIYDQIFVEKSLPICGNGVREGEEECDCGVEHLCFNLNCRPNECTQIVKTWQMYILLAVSVAVSLTALTLYIYLRFIRTAFRESVPGLCSQLLCAICSKCSTHLRQMPCCPRRHYANSMRLAGNTLSSSHLVAKKSKLDAKSIVVLIEPNDKSHLVRRPTFNRPSQPPPPPPPCQLVKCVTTPEIKTSPQSVDVTSVGGINRPPPLPLKPPPLSSLVAEQRPEEDMYEVPNSVRIRSSILSALSHRVSARMTQLSTNFDSISHKFDDFEEESDADFGDNASVKTAVHYTPIIDKKDRPFQDHDDEINQREMTADCNTSEPASGTDGHLLKACLREVDRIKREESFSSNDSGDQRQCVSDDTGSTGLSEEDEKSLSVLSVVKRFNQRSWFV